MADSYESERVIINAPMSFSGAAQRAWRLGEGLNQWVRWLVLRPLFTLPLIALWWSAVLVWYLIFGIFLIPYRLLRRGARKRRAERLRHREVMSTLERKG
jgi:hypothetical protein